MDIEGQGQMDGIKWYHVFVLGLLLAAVAALVIWIIRRADLLGRLAESTDEGLSEV